MSPPAEILKLAERFDLHIKAYKSGRYNETQVRREFIDPFFKALGWDVHNEQGFAEAYKDVIHEDAIKIGGITKAPDYCFRVGGSRKFFVEAKKPSVNIHDEPGPAYQLRRYAWSAKLPLSVVTDFEEFAVYDCRVRPVKTDGPAKARVLYLEYTDYAERWDEIGSIFAREAILKGSFDKYAESQKRKRGTAEVDDAFLSEIESWREALARNLALRNPGLSQRELNTAVQHTIDRIIFLRICEDRGIEPYHQLEAQTGGANVYRRLMELFHKADDRYNSGLFHFRREKGRPEHPDELTPRLVIDDKPLKHIIKSLYYPDSPYEFSVLPADILGQVYEQFLGKVIRLTPGHRAVIDDKPQVKKAGGVYYTPTYIVDYIVANTVAKLLEGKTPLKAAKLKILDPACGSGSFLIGAYQRLLDWHLDRYLEDGPGKHRKRLHQTQRGDWRLTTSERKRILLNNIFGVDIDAQAVEVTKLSLLLKVLEGESDETLSKQYQLFRERALPDLGGNIKCGNSLIGPDFYEGRQLDLLDEDERYRVNVFDWDAEFPDIMRAGGFDAVIGNPPYVRIQALRQWAPLEVDYYKEHYRAAGKGNYDVYVVFVERGLSLLNKHGKFGFILPHKFFNAQYGEPLRRIVASGKHLSEVVHFGDQQVFGGATTYTCLMFLDRAAADECRFVKVGSIEDWRSNGETLEGMVPARHISGSPWNFVVGRDAALFQKLSTMPTNIGDVAEIFVGLQTSADDVYILDFVAESHSFLTLQSKSLGFECELEKELVFPLVSGTDVHAYAPLPSRQFILFPYELKGKSASLIPFSILEQIFPLTATYLSENRKRLEAREKYKFKGKTWYRFGRSQNLSIQNRPKVCVPRLVYKLHAAYDKNGTHFLDNVDVNGVSLRAEHGQYDLRYILGLINSSLLGWQFRFVSAPFRGGWLSANRQFLSKLAVRTVEFAIAADKARHDRMVELVERTLELHKRLNDVKTGHDKTVVQRQVDATDRQIDRLVYELYDLTDDEIAIVEEADP